MRKGTSYSQETIDILRLIRSENVGPRTFHHLIELFGSSGKALDNIAALSLRGGKTKPIKVCSNASAAQEIAATQEFGAHIITYKDPQYSRLLLEIPDFPPVLSYKGNISLLNAKKKIAIVGARNCSMNARLFAANLVKELVGDGCITVSGLARGIDAVVHDASGSSTIAVIAGGIDNIYPLENRTLFKKISHDGLLITELPIRACPTPQHFPQRNRIIAGLTTVTAVIEAGIKSGSLITANYAIEYNRDVFAVPGFPLDPRCAGTNKLIKDGAYVLESSQDIICYFNQSPIHLAESEGSNNNFKLPMSADQLVISDRDRKRVVDLLSAYPITIELLSQETKMPLPIIYTICLELELAGKITRHMGHKISLIY